MCNILDYGLASPLLISFSLVQYRGLHIRYPDKLPILHVVGEWWGPWIPAIL